MGCHILDSWWNYAMISCQQDFLVDAREYVRPESLDACIQNRMGAHRFGMPVEEECIMLAHCAIYIGGTLTNDEERFDRRYFLADVRCTPGLFRQAYLSCLELKEAWTPLSLCIFGA